MTLTNCDAELGVIQALPDTPPAGSADALKAAFDKASDEIINWLNGTHLNELETEFNSKQDILSTPSNDRVIVSSAGSMVESSITTTELNALSGVNSNIQNQLDALRGKITYGTTAPAGGSNGDIYIQYS